MVWSSSTYRGFSFSSSASCALTETIYTDPPQLIPILACIKLTHHSEHPLYNVPFSKSRKNNMNVLLDIAQYVVETLQIAMVFLDVTLGNSRITSDPVKV